jgi:hypothetical protein
VLVSTLSLRCARGAGDEVIQEINASYTIAMGFESVVSAPPEPEPSELTAADSAKGPSAEAALLRTVAVLSMDCVLSPLGVCASEEQLLDATGLTLSVRCSPPGGGEGGGEARRPMVELPRCDSWLE